MPEFDPSRLRAARHARGLTADQTAVAAGRSTSAIFKYESGEITPTLPSLCRLAEVLSCEVGDFFDPDVPSRRNWLTSEQYERIREQVRSRPPLTDSDIEKIAAVIARSRLDRLEQGAAG